MRISNLEITLIPATPERVGLLRWKGFFGKIKMGGFVDITDPKNMELGEFRAAATELLDQLDNAADYAKTRQEEEQTT